MAARQLAEKMSPMFPVSLFAPSLMKISAEDAELARSFDEDDIARGLRGLKEIGPKSCTVSGGARYVVNVGSVGLPREGPCGTYCTYDVQNGKLQFVFLAK